jgi:hypothetical protein
MVGERPKLTASEIEAMLRAALRAPGDRGRVRGWRRSIGQDSADLPEAALRDRSERRPRALAPDSQGRPDRECLGRRNQNRALKIRRRSAKCETTRTRSRIFASLSELLYVLADCPKGQGREHLRSLQGGVRQG